MEPNLDDVLKELWGLRHSPVVLPESGQRITYLRKLVDKLTRFRGQKEENS